MAKTILTVEAAAADDEREVMVFGQAFAVTEPDDLALPDQRKLAMLRRDIREGVDAIARDPSSTDEAHAVRASQSLDDALKLILPDLDVSTVNDRQKQLIVDAITDPETAPGPGGRLDT